MKMRGGIAQCCNQATTLISPETPAAASKWLMLCLHRSDDQWLIAIAEHRAKGFDLQRISELRPGSMRLYETYRAATLGKGQRHANDRLPRRTIGRREAAAGLSWLDSAAADQSRDASPSACAC